MPVRRYRPRVQATEDPPQHRAGKVAAVLGVLVAVVGVEFLLFGDEVRRNLQVLLTHQSARAAESRRPAPLPVVAPPAAGAITQVELRPLDTCRAAQACTVLLQVGLTPGRQPVPVSWHLDVIDRCGTARQRQAGGPVSVPPGQDRLVQTLALNLPAGQSLAVIPIVTQPARAAGRPMELPGAGDHC